MATVSELLASAGLPASRNVCRCSHAAFDHHGLWGPCDAPCGCERYEAKR